MDGGTSRASVPCKWRYLSAYIPNAVLRRAAPPPNEAVAHCGDLAIDTKRRVVMLRGDPISLTRQEFDLLALLVANAGAVFSRRALLSQVWRDDSDVTERTVDAAISRLRRKIERRPETPELIGTVWGSGYRFRDRLH